MSMLLMPGVFFPQGSELFHFRVSVVPGVSFCNLVEEFQVQWRHRYPVVSSGVMAGEVIWQASIQDTIKRRKWQCVWWTSLWDGGSWRLEVTSSARVKSGPSIVSGPVDAGKVVISACVCFCFLFTFHIQLGFLTPPNHLPTETSVCNLLVPSIILPLVICIVTIESYMLPKPSRSKRIGNQSQSPQITLWCSVTHFCLFA